MLRAPGRTRSTHGYAAERAAARHASARRTEDTGDEVLVCPSLCAHAQHLCARVSVCMKFMERSNAFVRAQSMGVRAVSTRTSSTVQSCRCRRGGARIRRIARGGREGGGPRTVPATTCDVYSTASSLSNGPAPRAASSAARTASSARRAASSAGFTSLWPPGSPIARQDKGSGASVSLRAPKGGRREARVGGRCARCDAPARQRRARAPLLHSAPILQNV